MTYDLPFKKLKKDGFVVLESYISDDLIDSTISSFLDICNYSLKNQVSKEFSNLDNALIKIRENNEDYFKKFISSFSRLYEVELLCTNPKIIDFIREYFEKSRIMLSGRPIVHMQGPVTSFKNGYFGLPPHQDFPSTQGSTDGLVIWIPLMNITNSSYPIMIAPNSHKNKQIHPYYVNKQSTWVVKNESVPFCNFKEVICRKGDVVVFDVFTVHKSSTSGDNINRIAISQRFDNCSDPIFLERGLPTGYKTVVKRKETGALLPDTNLIPNLFEK